MKVLVLMSTYNGQEYLEEQLESIRRQEDVEVSLLVRDDGSNDNTLEILRNYKSLMNIIVIRGVNTGPAKSFMELLRCVSYKDLFFDYVAFCDQDDSWMSDKLKVAVKKLEECDNSRPCLYCGFYQMTDSNLSPIPTKAINPVIDIYHSLTSNFVTGCTMVFNKKLFKLVEQYAPDYVSMHDSWVYRICMACGGSVVYDPVPHILYRQHSHNVIGGKNESLILRWWLRIKKIFIPGNHFYSKTAAELLKGYQKDIVKEYLIVIQRLAGIEKFSNRILLAFNNNFYKELSLEYKIRLFVLFLTGKI